MAFTPDEIHRLETDCDRLLKKYFEVKEHVISSEKAVADLVTLQEGPRRERISVLAINELRNSFDHLMRAKNVWRDVRNLPGSCSISPFEYCCKHIDKALGHVFRAGYDALDILTSARLEEINFLRRPFSIAMFLNILPDYAQTIRKPIEHAISQCNSAKLTKDVESSSQEHLSYQAYCSALKKLNEVRELLYEHLPELSNIHEEGEKQQLNSIRNIKKQRTIAIIIAVISFLACTMVALFLFLVR